MNEDQRTPAPILKVENLWVSFSNAQGVLPAVGGVSFELNRGEILALVGESGSGKSLTALSIIGLLPSAATWQANQLQFQNKENAWVDLKTNAARMRGMGIGMIFQDAGTALNPLETCGEQIAESLRYHFRLSRSEARARALVWLERVELGEAVARVYGAYPHELSGGQKQRVLIAGAMSLEPRVLIADEPTTALDVTVQQQILTMIRSLCARYGTAVLFISHDLNLVGSVADRVVVMRRGELLEENTTSRIFQQPAHPYTAALLRCRPGMATKEYRLPVPEIIDGENISRRLYPREEAVPLSPELLLEVRDIGVRYPVRKRWPWDSQQYVRALENVHFSLHKGQTMGVAGESGSGKTTLAKVLLGLQKPDEGRLWFGGDEIDMQYPSSWTRWRRAMQLIFQDPFASLNPRMPVGEAILEPMRYHQIGADDTERMELIAQIVDRVGIHMDHLKRMPHAFSGGQRQRIGIARALVLEPQFLVCDESVASLDVSVQAQTLNLLKDLQEEKGLTYLFISHDLSVIRFMSDTVMVLQKGLVVESGDSDRIFSHPSHPYTRRLLDAVPKFK